MKASWLAIAALLGAAPPPDIVRFVACPVYRDVDAGKKSGCWLADDSANGARYDVTLSPTKPDWNRAVLVEGRVAAKPDPAACGGIVLDPVRDAVLDEPCTRFMLEGEGYAGHRFVLPRRNVRPLYEQREPPARPFAAKRFVVPFDFGSDFIVYQLGDYYLDRVINYAIDVAPARITVTGYAAAPIEVSGHPLAEPAGLARSRADRVARALVLRGVPADSITVATDGHARPSEDEAFDRLPDASHHRVEVAIDPVTPKKNDQ